VRTPTLQVSSIVYLLCFDFASPRLVKSGPYKSPARRGGWRLKAAPCWPAATPVSCRGHSEVRLRGLGSCARSF
jgi:hypothetical protein